MYTVFAANCTHQHQGKMCSDDCEHKFVADVRKLADARVVAAAVTGLSASALIFQGKNAGKLLYTTNGQEWNKVA